MANATKVRVRAVPAKVALVAVVVAVARVAVATEAVAFPAKASAIGGLTAVYANQAQWLGAALPFPSRINKS